MKNNQKKKRLAILYAVVCLLFVMVALRLGQFQLIKADEYGKIVDRQSSGKRTVPAERGILYDRNGQVIVNNVLLNSIYAQPRSTKELKQVAAHLEKTLNMSKGTAVKRYGLKVDKFCWIKRKMADSTSDRVMANAPNGLFFDEEPERVYPYGLIGKQVLGFTDIDGIGQSGLELMFNEKLAGKEGQIGYRRDGKSNAYRIKREAIKNSVPGQSMVLTVDWKLQEIVEQELKAGCEKYNAKSAMAVFLNNNNGEILAMAYFDPNEKNPHLPIKHRAVTDQFEPGSIFKALSMVGFLEDSLAAYSDSIDCEMGKWRIKGRTLHDDKELGFLSIRDVFKLSSNIGMAKYAISQGGPQMCVYLDRFKVGQKIGLGWPGEASGRLRHLEKWPDITIANVAIGQGVSTTALQMAAYVSAIANGGKLYRPEIILTEIDETGNPINQTPTELIAEVMSPEIADTLRSFMRAVVEDGTATLANSEVITIAGKTGTAQIFDVVNKRYFRTKYNGSFVGYFPAEEPLITGIVVYTEPNPIRYGGHTAGPVFRKIAERYSMMKPDLFTVDERILVENSNKFDSTTIVPDIIGYNFSEAKAKLNDLKLEFRVDDTLGIINWQFPPANRLVFEGDEIIISTLNKKAENKMSDLRGLSIREVSAFMHHLGIKYSVTGNGLVVKQSIKPGMMLSGNEICNLTCQPI